MADKKADWGELIVLVLVFGAIGAAYAVFTGQDPVSGFFRSVRAFGTAFLIIALVVGIPATIGWLSGKGKAEKEQRMFIGAGVGGFLLFIWPGF